MVPIWQSTTVLLEWPYKLTSQDWRELLDWAGELPRKSRWAT